MFRNLWTILLLMTAFRGGAQNLVTNPSFELYDSCPFTFGQMHYPPAPPAWPHSVTSWYSSCQNSPDYYNSCSADVYSTVPVNFHGYQPARTGNAYVGLVFYSGVDLNNANGYREYVHSRLLSPLSAGKKYKVSYYVNYPVNGDFPVIHNMMATNEFGAHFSASAVTSPMSPLNVPYLSLQATGGAYLKDSAGWTEVTGIYTAAGGEEWITIGSFGTGSVPPMIQAYPPTAIPGAGYNAYYFIDDVSVTEIINCDTLTALHTVPACAMEPFALSLTSPHAGMTYLWSTGATTKDITVSSPGTYWVVSQSGCDLYTDSFRVTPLQTGVTVNYDTLVCDPEGIVLEAASGGTSYRWSNGATTASIVVNDYGIYTCQFIKDCLLRTEIFEVKQRQSPAGVDIGDDIKICKEEPVMIGRDVNGASAYLWSTGETSCCITPPATGSYWVAVTAGCRTFVDTIEVTINECSDCLIVPSAFSPNGDGQNDRFHPIVRCPVKGFSLRIFNRWGEQVFASFDPGNGPDAGWDGSFRGQKADIGTYYYIAEYFTDSKTRGREIRKGDVTVVY